VTTKRRGSGAQITAWLRLSFFNASREYCRFAASDPGIEKLSDKQYCDGINGRQNKMDETYELMVADESALRGLIQAFNQCGVSKPTTRKPLPKKVKR